MSFTLPVHARGLMEAKAGALHETLSAGHPIPPEALEDTVYKGISLGLPGFVDRLLWKTFSKVFHRDPVSQRLRGWNVRVEQTGIEGPLRPRQRRGLPVTFGHYEVRPASEYRPPQSVGEGLMLDYGRGGNGLVDPVRRVRDPLVAIQANDFEALLGWSYVDLGWTRVGTPSFFLLLRAGPLEHIASPPRPR